MRMRGFRFTSVLFLFISSIYYLSAQIQEPVKWSFSVSTVDEQTVDVIAQLTADKGWHAYSSFIGEGGPQATVLSFEQSDDYKAEGKVLEMPQPQEKFDATFQMKIALLENQSKVIQRVKLQKPGHITIKGTLLYMACNDESCLPPDKIEFSLNYVSDKATVLAPVSSEKEPEIEQADSTDKSSNPPTKSDDLSKHGSASELKSADQPIEGSTTPSHWALFWLAFGSGLIALLTPCVFPMIPMTVSYFTKQSKTRAAGVLNAIIYGLSIIFIYVILGTVVVIIFGPDSLNSLSTHPLFNLFFALLLIVFAISFFGAFEIVLPSKWANAADKKADKGGLIGIFFMAFTLALVSFSCTGPLVGSLIVQAAREGGMAPVIGMLGFSTAVAIPFAFFAVFPGYLNSLPKSGGWLNSVKVILGFIELAFAFKFLSIADMVLELHWLERELFIAIWIAIALAMGLYLLGQIRLPHDSPLERVSVGRLMLALTSFAFAIYMMPGLWGAPVNLISGFPPPKNYAESPFGVGNSAPSELIKGMHYGAQNIPAFDDYETALAHARKVGKPLLIDFTGAGCVNCRKMEDMVWSNEDVKNMLTHDFVLVSLIVDIRTPLPLNEQYVSPVTGKKIETVGNKWSDFQMTRYHRNSQPHYIILDRNEKEIVPSRAYDPDIKEYIKWLREALTKYKQSSE